MSGIARARKALFASVLTALALGLTLGLAEFYLRYYSNAAAFDPEALGQRNTLHYVPSLFCRHVLAAEADTVAPGTGIRYHVNSLGYRGPEFAADKPAGTVRIMVFGGSAVFDLLQSDDDDWPHAAQEMIRRAGFPRVEVINAGIPGLASFDAVGLLFAEGARFQPDYTVIYCAWNDIKYFRESKSLLRLFQPWHPSQDPRTYYHNAVDRLLGEHLLAYRLLRDRYYVNDLGLGAEGARPRGTWASALEPAALDQYRLDMRLFCDLARDAGARPVLMTQARLVAPANTAEQKKRIAYDLVLMRHGLLCEAFARTDDIVKQTAHEKGAALIDASALMTGRDEWFHDHVHLTTRGSHRLAEIFAREMVSFLQERSAGQAAPAPAAPVVKKDVP